MTYNNRGNKRNIPSPEVKKKKHNKIKVLSESNRTFFCSWFDNSGSKQWDRFTIHQEFFDDLPNHVLPEEEKSVERLICKEVKNHFDNWVRSKEFEPNGVLTRIIRKSNWKTLGQWGVYWA